MGTSNTYMGHLSYMYIASSYMAAGINLTCSYLTSDHAEHQLKAPGSLVGVMRQFCEKCPE